MKLSVTDLSKEAGDLLFEKATLLRLKNKDILLEEGKTCKDIWYIESGCIKSGAYKDGKEISLNFSFQGEFVTDLKSIRLGTPVESYLQARGDCVVITLSKSRLQELYKQSAEISFFGRRLLEQLLTEQEEHTNLFKLKTPTERYQHIIANKPTLLQRITLTELASYLGISRETLTRIRQTM